jgi:tripartite-type tricarboxylate transporter receptor subunit TctC
MNLLRKLGARTAAGALGMLLTAAWVGNTAQAQAQQAASKPISVIVPFSAGSASDVIGRFLLDKVAANSGRSFVYLNRPAAGGNVGTLSVVRAEPDGLTIGFSTSGPLAVNKILNAELGYDPEKDLQPIGVVAVLPNIVVVSAELPIDSLARLIDYLKKTPDVGYGSVGPGSSQHLAGAFFEQLIGARMTHVPYRVTGNLVTDLVSGRVPVSFQLLPNVLGSIQGAKVRPLAVAAKSRLPALPNVPTAAEAGLPEYESAAWFALIAPRGIARAYVDRLNADVNVALRDPAVRSRFSDLGAEPRESSPEDMTRVMADDIAKWGAIIRKGGISLTQ